MGLGNMVGHIDGTDRAPMPTPKDLIVGGFSEFIAMTLFVYFGCGAAASNAHRNSPGDGEWDSSSVTIIAFQFGFGITVLAYAVAHTSGAHINCAVLWALMLVGTCHPVRFVVYFVCQILGSILGAGMLYATFTDAVGDRTKSLGANGLQNVYVGTVNGVPQLEKVATHSAVLGELMGTALLVYVVLETAVNTKAATSSHYTMIRGQNANLAPIPIGLAVFMAHVLLIPITGCSINPTRSFGPAVVANVWNDHWIFWVGPFVGSTIAVIFWAILKYVDPAEREWWLDARPNDSSAPKRQSQTDALPANVKMGEGQTNDQTEAVIQY